MPVRTRGLRDLRIPDDLGTFFHPACAARVNPPEALRNSVAEVLAEVLVTEYKRVVERRANVQEVASMDLDPPGCQAAVASIDGRRVFTMTRAEWARLRGREGKLVAIELERVPPGSVAESASVIACLAAECPIEAGRIEVWRHSEKASPSPTNVQKYLVLEDLTRQLNAPVSAERAAAQDSPKLRKRGSIFASGCSSSRPSRTGAGGR